jgi:hypothetical protein
VTKYRWHNADAAINKSKSKDLDELDYAIFCAMESLVKEGLFADSGKREWSERTGRYEIVWVRTDKADATSSTLKQRSRPKRLN